MRKILFFIIAISFFMTHLATAQDWRKFYENTNFEKYKEANEQFSKPIIGEEKRIVFMGNSITEGWPILRPQFFENANYIGRGISGQTTPQMLLRFRRDVINLRPHVVVILAGINDIAENTGFTPIEIIAENIMSMAELAKHHNIQVVICSVLPALDFPWKRGLQPANKVIQLNTILEKYADQNDLPYVDYHSAMKDENNGLKVPEYTWADDLVHPKEAGYILMEKLVQPAIDKALSASSFSINPFFTDHMVLQQNEKVAIWGKAAAGNQVTVKGSWGTEAIATADKEGNWRLDLKTPKAGGPYQLDLISASGSTKINDVMIGEVWLASGQSNMSMPLKGWPPNDPIKNAQEEIANAEYPNIRMFTVAQNYALEEVNTFDGTWEICTPEAAKDFSATAYFFARRMHQDLKVPIGIVHTSWGGTPAESWISKKRIKKLGDFDKIVEAIENPTLKKEGEEWFSKWEKRPFPKEIEDWNELDLGDLAIAQPDFVEKNWSTMKLPGRLDLYKDLDFDGAFWFRKTIEIEDVSTAYSFSMGPVDDTDAVFINGEKIGGMVNNYSDKRNYPIPKALLKKGKNTIAIRIIDTGGPGSISGEMKLISSNSQTISLEGEWNYLITAEIFMGAIYVYGQENSNLSERPSIVYPSPYSTPSTLYNAMIHPLLPYTIKGAIWYQGESNVGRAEQYQRLFPAMIEDWRKQWNSEFPFYFVQIAPYQYNNSGDLTLDESQKLREAQRQTLAVNKTGMVVTLDIGNKTNIHPANKQDVGSRLAGLALANDYRKNIIASGPLYKSHLVKRKKIFLEFNAIGSGLMAKNSNLSGFEIAGENKKYVPAKAIIVKDKVVVFASNVKSPKFVRYAWKDNAIGTLFNIEGLPASSFSTEN